MSQTAEQKAEKEAEKARKVAEKAAKDANNEGDTSASDESAPETQKIKFLRSHPSYGYWPGEVADLTAEHVELLVEGKFAELHTPAEATKTAE